MTTAQVELPPKLIPVFTPARGEAQYRAAWGGRGSGKSFTFAKMAAIWGYAEPLRILATRELQVSIKESFHAELKAAIESEPWLEAHYDVGVDYLRGKNGTEFIFRGLRHNTSSIKSLAKIDLTIVEEAEDVPEQSWVALEATVLREPKSELWVIWNPETEESPVDKRFRLNPPDSAIVQEMNWRDNPWFPEGLNSLRLSNQKTMDPATYAWIWEGEYRGISDAQVFNGKYRVDEFEPGSDWDGPYYGLDFGFANDPTAGVKCWIHDNRLYIEYDAGKVGLELDHTPKFLKDNIPGIEKHAVRADNARPESISYIKRNGIPNIVGVKKGKGSVEDGVEHIKSYDEVIIHPRCEHTQREFRLYKYKTDKLSGDILPVIVDANNHWIDAIRYALEPIMKHRKARVIAPSGLGASSRWNV